MVKSASTIRLGTIHVTIASQGGPISGLIQQYSILYHTAYLK